MAPILQKPAVWDLNVKIINSGGIEAHKACTATWQRPTDYLSASSNCFRLPRKSGTFRILLWISLKWLKMAAFAFERCVGKYIYEHHRRRHPLVGLFPEDNGVVGTPFGLARIRNQRQGWRPDGRRCGRNGPLSSCQLQVSKVCSILS